jgi:hypothetical protein
MENTEAGIADNSTTTVLGSIQAETNTQPQIPVDPNAPPASSFTELLNGDQFIDNWADRLPGELKEYSKTLSKFKTPGQLMASYASLEREFSKRTNDGVKMPGEGATDEDWQSYAKKIGAPTRDDYKVSKPSDVPDELFNKELVDRTLDIAAKYGLPGKAVEDLVAAYSENLTGMLHEEIQAEQQAVEQVMSTLKSEFGNTLPTQIQKAQRAAIAVGLDVNDPSIGNNVSIIKALIKVDEIISEDTLQIPGVAGGNTYEELYNKVLKSDDYNGKNGMKKQMEAATKLQGLWQAMNNG